VSKPWPWKSCTLHCTLAFLQHNSALYHVCLIDTISGSRHNVCMINQQSKRSLCSLCRVSLAKGKSQMPTCHHHPGWVHSPRNPPLCLLLLCDPPLLPPGLVQPLRFQEQPLSPYLLHQSCPQGRRHHHSCHHPLRAHHSWLHHKCAPQASLWPHHKCPL